MDLIQAAGGLPEDTGKVVSGGPMMGKAIADLDVPIAKGTSGILMIRRSESVRAEVYNCVHCGNFNGVEPVYMVPPYTGTEASPILEPVICFGPAGATATLRQRRFWSAESGLEQ
jgi:hypothetical protein